MPAAVRGRVEYFPINPGEMSAMRHVVLLVLLVSLLSGSALAGVCAGKNHPGITAIYLVQSTKENSAAEQWVTGFKDRIKESDPYCLVTDKDKSVMVVSVVGMDADVNKTSTAISIAIYTAKESLFLDHWMYVASDDNLQSSYEKAVKALEKEMRELKRLRLIR
jgi:ABC-type sugar transport system substrate-binding protein